MNEQQNKLIGLFSQNAKECVGSSIYLSIDGKEVEITAVYPENQIDDYKWKDKVVVGEVTKWLRKGSQGYWDNLRNLGKKLSYPKKE